MASCCVSGRIHFDLDQVGEVEQGIHSRTRPEIVQRDPIPLLAHAAYRLQDFLVRLDVFGQLDHGLAGREAGIQILQKHVPAEVDAAELSAKHLVPTDGQHAMGNHLPGGRTGLGPVEVRGSRRRTGREVRRPTPCGCGRKWAGARRTLPRLSIGRNQEFPHWDRPIRSVFSATGSRRRESLTASRFIGPGKRIAVGLADQLRRRFPDGLPGVPLRPNRPFHNVRTSV